jgi:hypothetical protein
MNMNNPSNPFFNLNSSQSQSTTSSSNKQQLFRQPMPMQSNLIQHQFPVSCPSNLVTLSNGNNNNNNALNSNTNSNSNSNGDTTSDLATFREALIMHSNLLLHYFF